MAPCHLSPHTTQQHQPVSFNLRWNWPIIRKTRCITFWENRAWHGDAECTESATADNSTTIVIKTSIKCLLMLPRRQVTDYIWLTQWMTGGLHDWQTHTHLRHGNENWILQSRKQKKSSNSHHVISHRIGIHMLHLHIGALRIISPSQERMVFFAE